MVDCDYRQVRRFQGLHPQAAPGFEFAQRQGRYAVPDRNDELLEHRLPSDRLGFRCRRPRRCTTCHDATKATQANNYLTNPSAVACGSCHDDVNLATGKNHPGGPQIDDSHVRQLPHPTGRTRLRRLDHWRPHGPDRFRAAPTTAVGCDHLEQRHQRRGRQEARHQLQSDRDGRASRFAPSVRNSITFMMAGPTTDYGTTNFGSTVTTPGYVTESALTTATCTAAGACTLHVHPRRFPPKPPEAYAIGVRSPRAPKRCSPAPPSSDVVEYGAKNQVMYFSVDGIPGGSSPHCCSRPTARTAIRVHHDSRRSAQ